MILKINKQNQTRYLFAFLFIAFVYLIIALVFSYFKYSSFESITIYKENVYKVINKNLPKNTPFIVFSDHVLYRSSVWEKHDVVFEESYNPRLDKILPKNFTVYIVCVKESSRFKLGLSNGCEQHSFIKDASLHEFKKIYSEPSFVVFEKKI